MFLKSSKLFATFLICLKIVTLVQKRNKFCRNQTIFIYLLLKVTNFWTTNKQFWQLQQVSHLSATLPQLQLLMPQVLVVQILPIIIIQCVSKWSSCMLLLLLLYNCSVQWTWEREEDGISTTQTEHLPPRYVYIISTTQTQHLPPRYVYIISTTQTEHLPPRYVYIIKWACLLLFFI